MPPRLPFFILTALSLSIGWGIRGNFGHEAGVMIAGALSAMAVALLSGREDWQRRVAYFAAFGAVGWCFGGSISYMQVIAYTHSGHSPSVLYGFACLFVIGFTWAAMGGAGTALPAFLTRERLTEFFPALIVLFVSLWVRDIVEIYKGTVDPAFRQTDPFYWYDTDWTAALVAVVVMPPYALVRRRLDEATKLILHMAIGWWVGFLILPVWMGVRMTPPRSDDWAGCLGMMVGMWVYLQRSGLTGVTFASVVTGFIGGLGFASATCLKLVEVTSGLQTNWHSILEQTYGLINGLGVAVAFWLLIPRARTVSENSHIDPDSPVSQNLPIRRWTDWFAVAFVALLVTYLNMQKNPEQWIEQKAVPEYMYGIHTIHWFNMGFAALSAVVIWLLVSHMRRPLALIPSAWLGKGQLLYLAFLWCMVIMNFERAVVSFAPQRLVTEGVIFLNAVVCTLLVLSHARRDTTATTASLDFRPLLRSAIAVGAACMLLSVLAEWGIVRMIYGDRFAGEAGLHIRFGPKATATDNKPAANKPHP
jgi:hypothetical protein